MDYDFSVAIDAGEVEKTITLIGSRLENLPLKLLAEDVKTSADDLIQAEGALAGSEKWTALSPATIRRNHRRVGGKLLQATGQLANLQTFVGSNYFGVRSPAPYAGYHVTGTKHMPKRDFLDIDIPALLDHVADELAMEATR